MPRKPRTRPRGSPARISSFTGPPASRSRTDQTFWQCQACGGLVDPMYGQGDDSWCPSCHVSGEVYGMEGQLPSPQLYGEWVVKQQRKAEAKRAEAEMAEFLKEEPTMKRKKTHTGTYHCPACFIEFDLVAEEGLKCDECRGPLAKGTLDEVWDDSEEPEAEGDEE